MPSYKEVSLSMCFLLPFLGNIELQKNFWVHICLGDIRLNNVSWFGTLSNLYINFSNDAKQTVWVSGFIVRLLSTGEHDEIAACLPHGDQNAGS